ncbi:hypothetical protein EMIT0P2_50257 [Pseudomonas sp. IT-P2]
MANPAVRLPLADAALRRSAMKPADEQLKLIPIQGLEANQ